jgi:hypothetical protein
MKEGRNIEKLTITACGRMEEARWRNINSIQ